MASIKTDNGLEGMRNNFEATAAHLLPYDPVAKKRSGGQKGISSNFISNGPFPCHHKEAKHWEDRGSPSLLQDW